MKNIILIIILALVIVGCKTTISEESKMIASDMYGIFNNYLENNPHYFYSNNMITSIDIYDKADYCKYDILFKELALIGRNIEFSCEESGIVLESFSSSIQEAVSSKNFTLEDYDSEDIFTTLIIYNLDDEASANDFFSQIVQTIRKAYENNYDFVEEYENASFFMRDLSYRDINQAYQIEGVLPESDNFVNHNLIVIQINNIIIVQKTQNAESRLLIKV